MARATKPQSSRGWCGLVQWLSAGCAVHGGFGVEVLPSWFSRLKEWEERAAEVKSGEAAVARIPRHSFAHGCLWGALTVSAVLSISRTAFLPSRAR